MNQYPIDQVVIEYKVKDQKKLIKEAMDCCNKIRLLLESVDKRIEDKKRGG